MESSSIKMGVARIGALLLIAILSVCRTSWSLYGFAASIPLLSGLQMLGLTGPVPLSSFIFAALYFFWFPKKIISNEGINPKSGIENLVDILSGMTLLSVLVTLWSFPTDLILEYFWHRLPGSQREIFYTLDAAFVLLQGLFFYRMIELEENAKAAFEKVILVLYLQTFVIIFFSFIQLFFRVPEPFLGLALYAPFEDKNAYGSYLLVLFSVLLFLTYRSHDKRTLLNHVFFILIFLFMVLSYSRAAWLAAFAIGAVVLMQELSGGKKFSIIFLLILFLASSHALLGHSLILKGIYKTIIRYMEPFIDFGTFNLSGRSLLWHRALSIIGQFPLTGSGIGTFYRISPSFQDVPINEMMDFYENAHNYFLQMAAELGIPALLVLSIILFHTYRSGYKNLTLYAESIPWRKGLLLGLTAYLITCIFGHPLLSSSQQFLFWFIVSRIASPVNLKEKKGTPNQKSVKLLALLIGLGMFLAVGYEHKRVASGHGSHTYDLGFYAYEIIDGENMRWTGQRAFMKGPVQGKYLAMDVYAAPHNIGPQGLNLQFTINGKLWDEVKFAKSEKRHLQYRIPYEKDQQIEMKWIVNKTFIPNRLGLSGDTRRLGVMISEMKWKEG